MSCADCTAAQTAPLRDGFTRGCVECLARVLAATGAHLESEAAGKRTEAYTDALKTLFGDKADAGHQAVKQWAKAIKNYKATA